MLHILICEKCHFHHLFIFHLKPKLYRSVIEDVINDVRDIFLDDGVDEQVLMELKTVSPPPPRPHTHFVLNILFSYNVSMGITFDLLREAV